MSDPTENKIVTEMPEVEKKVAVPEEKKGFLETLKDKVMGTGEVEKKETEMVEMETVDPSPDHPVKTEAEKEPAAPLESIPKDKPTYADTAKKNVTDADLTPEGVLKVEKKEGTETTGEKLVRAVSESKDKVVKSISNGIVYLKKRMSGKKVEESEEIDLGADDNVDADGFKTVSKKHGAKILTEEDKKKAADLKAMAAEKQQLIKEEVDQAMDEKTMMGEIKKGATDL